LGNGQFRKVTTQYAQAQQYQEGTYEAIETLCTRKRLKDEDVPKSSGFSAKTPAAASPAIPTPLADPIAPKAAPSAAPIKAMDNPSILSTSSSIS
jgi:hypothetical protein